MEEKVICNKVKVCTYSGECNHRKPHSKQWACDGVTLCASSDLEAVCVPHLTQSGVAIIHGDHTIVIKNGDNPTAKGHRQIIIYRSYYDDGKTWSMKVYNEDHGGIAKGDAFGYEDRAVALDEAIKFVKDGSKSHLSQWRGYPPNY